jgi:hypothetical protein
VLKLPPALTSPEADLRQGLDVLKQGLAQAHAAAVPAAESAGSRTESHRLDVNC